MIQSSKNIEILNQTEVAFSARLKDLFTPEFFWYTILKYTMDEHRYKLKGITNWFKCFILEGVAVIPFVILFEYLSGKEKSEMYEWELFTFVIGIKNFLTIIAILSTHFKVKSLLKELKT